MREIAARLVAMGHEVVSSWLTQSAVESSDRIVLRRIARRDLADCQKATLGIFLKGVIQANDKLSQPEREQAMTASAALMDWVQPAQFTDRARARRAVAAATATARALDLPTLQQTRALTMIPALEKAGIALKGVKDIGRIYGVDADAALAGTQAQVLSVDGDLADMQVSVPLFGKTLNFRMELLRRDGRWYPADSVRQTEAELAAPLAPVAAVSAPAR